ncbi:agmatine deiminase family protein [Silvibacterium dinghuense]|uniref:Agmatine deiminase family protein n=1 Tax=Silvibacterium dinghuense TaxID=1560006 RepID=A0A4Q1S8W5_9BACT|nr:agmatine deiminase family protein [Silvibacterium dinghuense]RXS93450.1 agmatine deiminase family protein [Silvibacterium dinghuense]GGH05940.1 agmatine deiminase [Silvibacterium dinghuense]
MTVATGTPREHGFRMPAEWARHEATWLAWPHNPNDWPGKFQAIPWVYADIVRHLSQVEEVHILVNHEAAEKRAESILRRSGANLARVHFHQVETDRVWTRDSGPIFVKKGDELAITHWQFNGWAKYPNHLNDEKIPAYAAEHLGMKRWVPMFGDHRIVLEGGSIDTNGAGVLLTTEECLLSEVQQRNPGLSRTDLEKVFHDYLGIDQVIWLNRGIAGDDTHGHVDDITRFTAENVIVTVVEPNIHDENHLPLAENLERLKAARNLQGGAYEIVELPMPAPVVFDGQRLPASYGNFYIANDLVLVPTFNDPNDRKALGIIAGLFPDREIAGIHCGDFIWGLGALHCMTQQQPA